MAAQRWGLAEGRGGCSALQRLPERSLFAVHTEAAPAPSPRQSIDIQAPPQTL